MMGSSESPVSRWPTIFSQGVVRALVWGGVAGVVAAAIRYGVIELEFFRSRCDAPMPLWCLPRQAVIFAADRWMIGGVSLVLGLYGLFRPARQGVALAAVIAGAAGLALYDADPASVGLVLGLAILAREARERA
jgi:hypothetical protein